MNGIQIGIVGGGSTYTPDLIDGLIRRRDAVPVERLVLMDIDPERQAIVAGLAERMLARAGLATRIETTTELEAAIRGADFVLGQIRVGRMEARVRDEQVSLRLGLIGQETTGLGGFANALRTIPPTLEIARLVAELAPNAWFINFSNPSGIVTEAVLKHVPGLKSFGICDVPVTLQHIIAAALGEPPEAVRADYLGLNHLGWVRDAVVDGRSVWSKLFDDPETFAALMARLNARTHFRPFDAELIQRLRLVPSIYLGYFYYPDEMLAALLAAPETRGQQVQRIERELLAVYGDPAVAEKPAGLNQRRATFYSEGALDVLAAIVTDTTRRIAVITRNGGAIDDLPPEVAIERDSEVDARGIRPIAVGRLPLAIRGLVQAIKAYEELTVEAAVTADRGVAAEALMVHPLIGSYPKATAALDAVVTAFADLLPPAWAAERTAALLETARPR